MTGKDLRIIFMGTPDFAVASLKALVEKHYQVVGVITSPDKPAGRGRQLRASAVKEYAVSQGIPVMQPVRLRDDCFLDELRALKADLQIVVAFRMLPEVVWDMPRMGTFNLHASLLPQYRGAAPLNWAIINGEQETGVTSFLLSHEIDTGAVLFQHKVPIGKDDTLEVIHDRLMMVGAGLVLKTTDKLAEGDYRLIDQSELIKSETLKPAPKLFKDDGRIDWTQPAEKIRNLIRGLSPYPAAWTEIVDGKGKTASLKIYFASIEPFEQPSFPGTIFSDGKSFLKIAAADAWLSLIDLQLSGKKRMPVAGLLRGFHGIDQLRIKQ